MIEQIWLLPPLGYGRLGASPTPCQSFQWGPNDLHPRGTGKTTIRPAETLTVAADGTLTASLPATVVFKDQVGFRPVAPFFELHGSWVLDGERHSGNITADVLAAFNIPLTAVRWRVEVANLKPFHITLIDDDRIAAAVDLQGNDTIPHPLAGVSPMGAQQPLIPSGRQLPLGSVQLTRPTAAFPELRLRFTPAAGLVYGPTNLIERVAALPPTSTRFVLPTERLVLNPDAAWCQASVTGEDPRTNPGALFAGADDNQSLGLVDDVCDGIIRCTLADLPPAVARIVVGPPDFAPDRRPFTSAADGLTDRVRRSDVRDPAYVEDEALTTREIRDLMERVFETMDNVNVDAQNDRAGFENERIAAAQGLPPEAARDQAFAKVDPVLGRPLPLTERGRQRHRRFLSLEVLEDILREQPDLIGRIIREPMTGDRYYDRRMPAVMRGSDRFPMHLTRRQYDLLVAWAARLRRNTEQGT